MRRCPLCHSTQTSLFHRNKKRDMYTCHHCQLVFSDAASHLPPLVEKQRYQESGGKKQPALTQFLISLIAQCEQDSNSPLSGLNFGRVLEPSSLSNISHHQHKISQYDPFFAPDHELLKRNYDYICCYKVFEHFRFPFKEWSLLGDMLKPGGWLAINTKLLTDIGSFDKWHHKNNLTHVSFYQRSTFEYLAEQAGFKLLFAANDLILVQKPSESDITRGQS
ncbi:class I SAM-dependent methyltransferase [Shewanella sp. D64]|uniref:methyltransferase domain-containing protein n=1 Tax=unclassified Shewanella TaxID=196818 RepID=UPI0022BA578D|nr:MULTISPECIES: methyltransferase domain-containing protein [unclassified Shewanella]MEC4725895.1 class I SAM-dependent methyltransferase [Shewanella sp. D64]MEC4737150.1 class I SAM-dependent methyltransferase [Shewanella sp. E94]WBJ95658.1 class I SAM-dependent methyltransferase [Shewanella sp. MTB7]